MVSQAIIKYPCMKQIKRRQHSQHHMGTFMYDKIPFRSMNAGATFKIAMDITFVGERDKSIITYLDDMIIFSKTDDEHWIISSKYFL